MTTKYTKDPESNKREVDYKNLAFHCQAAISTVSLMAHVHFLKLCLQKLILTVVDKTAMSLIRYQTS